MQYAQSSGQPWMWLRLSPDLRYSTTWRARFGSLSIPSLLSSGTELYTEPPEAAKGTMRMVLLRERREVTVSAPEICLSLLEKTLLDAVSGNHEPDSSASAANSCM